MAKFYQPSTASETALQEEIGGNRHVQTVVTSAEVCGFSHPKKVLEFLDSYRNDAKCGIHTVCYLDQFYKLPRISNK